MTIVRFAVARLGTAVRMQARAMWDMSLSDSGVRTFFIEQGAAHLLLGVAAKQQCHLRLRRLATHVRSSLLPHAESTLNSP